MKNKFYLSVVCVLAFYGCVEDRSITADPCVTDSDCPGRCVNDFCMPSTSNTQGAGGAIGEGGEAGEGGSGGNSAGSTGEAGSAGSTGEAGSAGSTGEAGNGGNSAGSTGEAGSAGSTGEAGSAGNSAGSTGEAGSAGSTGEAGNGGNSAGNSAGNSGEAGNGGNSAGNSAGNSGEAGSGGNSAGNSGEAGSAGNSAGSTGEAGSAGNSGEAGSAGNSGEAGSAGSTGEAGNGGNSAGSTGEAGSAGNSGEAGSAGNSGEAGSAGNSGEAGSAGNSGEAGSAGNSGEAGSAGSSGSFGCEVGTQPLPLSATAGTYAPTSRVTSLTVPSNTVESAEFGCQSVGAQQGSGLSGLLGLLNVELNDFYDINSANVVHQLLHLDGWTAGLRGDEVDNLSLNLYGGVLQGGQMSVDSSSFDGQGNAQTQFSAQVNGCELEASGAEFTIVPGGDDAAIPILGSLAMSNVNIFATLAVDDTGVAMSQGTVNGYIHRDALVDLVRLLKVECASDNRPSYCAQIPAFLLNDQFTAESATDNFLAPVLRNYDTQITANGMPLGGCAGGTCNAISVCLAFSADPIQVD